VPSAGVDGGIIPDLMSTGNVEVRTGPWYNEGCLKQGSPRRGRSHRCDSSPREGGNRIRPSASMGVRAVL